MAEAKFDPVQNRKNRKIILAIFGIPAIIFLLSTLLYYLVETKSIDLGTVNNGELITPPLPFSELPLLDLKGNAVDYSQPEPKWSFVVIGDQYCRNDCERMLYIARQSITALAKKMDRVRLIYATTDRAISRELEQRIDQEYHGVEILSVHSSAVNDLFAGTEINPFKEKQFFVVDQRGWLMMSYSATDTEQTTLNNLGKAIVRDMKRLIK